MNILRLSTVALTIVLFTMGALILPVNTALAHCKPGNPVHDAHCDEPPPTPDSGAGIVGRLSKSR